MTEPLKLSRWRVHERRSEFDAKARASLGRRPADKALQENGLSAACMGQFLR
jgi:hypothetical protein